MKDITEYIYKSYAEKFFLNEGLIDWFKSFVKKIKDNMTNRLKKDGSIDTIDVDISKNTNNFKMQNDPIQLSSIPKTTLKEWDSEVRFPETVKFINNIKTYTAPEGSDPYIYTSYYQDPENNEYLEAVLIMYEPKFKYLTDYTHILNIEVSKIYKKPEDIIKPIFNEFVNKIKDINVKNKGFTIIDQTDFKQLNQYIKALKFKEIRNTDLKNKPDNIYMLKK